MTIEQCIINYLASHRRLTIPGLGTFIVKSEESSQELLFSEFLKDDDGVLRGLLRGDGASEIEAAGRIDRLLFEIRHATNTQCGEYILAGLGRLCRDSSGVMLFEADDSLVVTVVEEQHEPTVNNINQLYEQLNEEQKEREEVEQLFSEQDRKVSQRVTQSGRRIYNMLWIIIPLIALLALMAFVGYVIIDQWRLGLMELPGKVVDLLQLVGINRVV